MWEYLHSISWAAIIILTVAAWIVYPKSEKKLYNFVDD